MKNAKKTNAKIETKIESNDANTSKKLTIANVARELNLNEKRARSTLRKNVKIYNAFRKQRFDANSQMHIDARDALKKLFNIA